MRFWLDINEYESEFYLQLEWIAIALISRALLVSAPTRIQFAAKVNMRMWVWIRVWEVVRGRGMGVGGEGEE